MCQGKSLPASHIIKIFTKKWVEVEEATKSHPTVNFLKFLTEAVQGDLKDQFMVLVEKYDSVWKNHESGPEYIKKISQLYFQVDIETRSPAESAAKNPMASMMENMMQSGAMDDMMKNMGGNSGNAGNSANSANSTNSGNANPMAGMDMGAMMGMAQQMMGGQGGGAGGMDMNAMAGMAQQMMSGPQGAQMAQMAQQMLGGMGGGQGGSGGLDLGALLGGLGGGQGGSGGQGGPGGSGGGLDLGALLGGLGGQGGSGGGGLDLGALLGGMGGGARSAGGSSAGGSGLDLNAMLSGLGGNMSNMGGSQMPSQTSYAAGSSPYADEEPAPTQNTTKPAAKQMKTKIPENAKGKDVVGMESDDDLD